MKKIGKYIIPDGFRIVGMGFCYCYIANDVGDVYLIRVLNGIQHFRRMSFCLDKFRQGAVCNEI